MRISNYSFALSVILATIALAVACSNDDKPKSTVLPTSTEVLAAATPASAPSPSPWKSSQPQVFPWPPDIVTDSNGFTIFDIWVNTGGLGISAGEVTLNYGGSGCQVQEFTAGSLLGKNPLVGHQSIDNNAGHAVLALARIGPTRLPTNAGSFGTVTMNCLPHTSIPILSLGLSAMMADGSFEKVSLVGRFAG